MHNETTIVSDLRFMNMKNDGKSSTFKPFDNFSFYHWKYFEIYKKIDTFKFHMRILLKTAKL